MIRLFHRRRGYCLRISGLRVEPAAQADQDALIERIWRERVARNIARRQAAHLRASLMERERPSDADYVPALLRRQAG